MAILTGSLRKGFVNHCLEKLGVARGVGHMAFAAVHHLGVNVNVSLAESLLFIVVAFPAQGLDRFVNQGQFR